MLNKLFIFRLMLDFFSIFFAPMLNNPPFSPLTFLVLILILLTHIHSHFLCLPSICPLPLVLHYSPPPCFPQVSTFLHPFSYPSTPPLSVQSSVQGSEHIRTTDSSLPVCPLMTLLACWYTRVTLNWFNIFLKKYFFYFLWRNLLDLTTCALCEAFLSSHCWDWLTIFHTFLLHLSFHHLPLFLLFVFSL